MVVAVEEAAGGACGGGFVLGEVIVGIVVAVIDIGQGGRGAAAGEETAASGVIGRGGGARGWCLGCGHRLSMLVAEERHAA
jgi:hypothetical protein